MGGGRESPTSAECPRLHLPLQGVLSSACGTIGEGGKINKPESYIGPFGCIPENSAFLGGPLSPNLSIWGGGRIVREVVNQEGDFLISRLEGIKSEYDYGGSYTNKGPLGGGE